MIEEAISGMVGIVKVFWIILKMYPFIVIPIAAYTLIESIRMIQNKDLLIYIAWKKLTQNNNKTKGDKDGS